MKHEISYMKYHMFVIFGIIIRKNELHLPAATVRDAERRRHVSLGVRRLAAKRALLTLSILATTALATRLDGLATARRVLDALSVNTLRSF